jgi:hypothetical protein
LSAALEGLDKIGTTAMEQLVTEKLLQLTGTEDYMRAGMDKPWGTHHNFLLTDSDGATLEGCLTHTPYTSARRGHNYLTPGLIESLLGTK